MLFPRLLRNHQHPHPGFSHDVAGFRRYDRTIHAVDEILVDRLRPNAHFRNLEELAVERKALLRERKLDYLGSFGKAFSRLAHRHPKSIELEASGAPPEPDRPRAA